MTIVFIKKERMGYNVHKKRPTASVGRPFNNKVIGWTLRIPTTS